jgi:hypothetical protein
MAPTFLQIADDVPVETQLILFEISGSPPDSIMETKKNRKNRKKLENLKESNLDGENLNIFGDKVFSQKKYAIIAPLIDFDCGFRTTLFGKEGGNPAGKGALAARIEVCMYTYIWICICSCTYIYEYISIHTVGN